MDIVIIGTGNVAQVMARLALSRGHKIVQVAGRDKESTRIWAEQLGVPSTTHLKRLIRAEIYIIAVTDSAISRLAQKIRPGSGIVAHTAGSVPLSALEPCGRPHGVLWPLQSIRANLERLPEIPWIVDGSEVHAREILFAFAGSISDRVALANDEQRLALHLAAVYTSNFMNQLFVQAQEFCTEKGLDFSLLMPLLEETVHRLNDAPAKALQTGPAIRGDRTTMRIHEALLKDRPDMLAIYKMMSRSIRSAHR